MLALVLLSQIHAQDYVGSLTGGPGNYAFCSNFMSQNKAYWMTGYSHYLDTTHIINLDSICLYGSDFLKRTIVFPLTSIYYWNYWEDQYGHTHGLSPQNYLIGGAAPIEYHPFSHSHSDPYFSYCVTQTLFNSDSKFEYVREHYDQNVDIVVRTPSSIYHHPRLSGFDVFNEDGELLTTILCPENECFKGDLGVLSWDNQIMLYATTFPNNVHPDSSRYWQTCFYRIDRQMQKIEQVASVPFSVRPTVMERGQEIVVELDEGSNAREIEVVNALGQTVKRVPVAAGQREVRIDSADMGSGMNFISTRTTEGQGTVKIIVR